MSKKQKTRNKKYHRSFCSFAAPYLTRRLHPAELSRMYGEIDQARMLLKLGTLDPMPHRLLWSIIGFGYIIADNFEKSDELKLIFLRGAAAVDRAAEAVARETLPAQEDLALVDEAVMYATDEIKTVDVFNLQKVENYLIRNAARFDRLVKKTAEADGYGMSDPLQADPEKTRQE